MQKHNNRTSAAHEDKEGECVSRIEELFDIAHADALSIMTNPEDRAFLLSEKQPGRSGVKKAAFGI